jgi:hypothetical protein
VTGPASTGDMAQFQLKVLAQAEAKAVFTPLPETGRPEQPPKACGHPSVTLQRQGEVVPAIRIGCGLGQVIELACAY